MKSLQELVEKYNVLCIEGSNCVGKNFLIEKQLEKGTYSIYKTFRSKWPGMISPKGRKARRLVDLDMTQAPSLVLDMLLQMHKEGNMPAKTLIMDRGFLSSWSYIMYKASYLDKPVKLTDSFPERLRLFDKQINDVNGKHIMLVASKEVLFKHWKERLFSKEFTPSLLQMLSIQKFMLELISKYKLKSFIFIEVKDNGTYDEISLQESIELSNINLFEGKIVEENYKVYLAGPFFNEAQKKIILTLEKAIEGERLDLFSPSRDSMIINKQTPKTALKEVFDLNCKEIDKADFLVALLDYPGIELSVKTDNGKLPISLPDSGTVWELGYAFAKGKPVIGIFSENPKKINLMLSEGILALTVGISDLNRVFEEIKAYVIDLKAGFDVSERVKHMREIFSISTELE